LFYKGLVSGKFVFDVSASFVDFTKSKHSSVFDGAKSTKFSGVNRTKADNLTVSLTLLGQTNQNLHKTEQCLYHQEKKNMVYISSPITKLLDRIQLGLENPVLHYEGSAESRNSATTIMCRIDCLYPVPHTSLVIRGERYIYCNPLFKLLPERPWVPLCSIPCTDRADCPCEENERL
jgi:hypothetical protein